MNNLKPNSTSPMFSKDKTNRFEFQILPTMGSSYIANNVNKKAIAGDVVDIELKELIDVVKKL